MKLDCTAKALLALGVLYFLTRPQQQAQPPRNTGVFTPPIKPTMPELDNSSLGSPIGNRGHYNVHQVV